MTDDVSDELRAAACPKCGAAYCDALTKFRRAFTNESHPAVFLCGSFGDYQSDACRIAALVAEVERSNKLLTQAVDLLHVVAEYGGTGPNVSAISFADLAARIEHHIEKGTDHAG